MPRNYSRFSISVGTKAYPEVKEAIDHGSMYPTHDPFVVCYADTEGQHVNWMCHECVNLDKNAG